MDLRTPMNALTDDPSGEHPLLVGLVVPADASEPVATVAVAASSAALSGLIGGGFLEDALYGQTDDDGGGYVVYLDEHRVAKGLRANERAMALVTQLGFEREAWLADLRGDVLVLGYDAGLDDLDVPPTVLAAADRAGLTGALER
jgi:hypothetical protein